MATLSKTRKVGEHRPPQDIRSDTKARRAWLAAKVADVSTVAGRSAKIVGVGSYQRVVEYETTQSEGRVRYRGVCQYCGGSQVVQQGALVLHGYNRPGDGALVGRCPDAGQKPIQAERSRLDAYARDAKAQLTKAARRVELAKAAEVEALDAMRAGDENRYEAARAEPREPRRNETIQPAEWRAYREARKAWRLAYPLNAAYDEAQSAARREENARWQIQQMVEHFARLQLVANTIHGGHLAEEVVA
jgi:hypothetical protein